MMYKRQAFRALTALAVAGFGAGGFAQESGGFAQDSAGLADKAKRLLAVDEFVLSQHLSSHADPSMAKGSAVSMQEVLFLGVSSEPISVAMAAQLPVPDGVGLLVTHVAPESPAAAAGVQVHDVLIQLDDQWLINPGQLAALVRMQDDEKAALTLQRKGKQHVVEAGLVKRMMPIARGGGLSAPSPLHERQLGRVPGDRWHKYAQKHGRRIELPHLKPEALNFEPEGFEGERRELTLRFKDLDREFRFRLPERGKGKLSTFDKDGLKLQELELSELESLDEQVREKLKERLQGVQDLETLDGFAAERLKQIEQMLEQRESLRESVQRNLESRGDRGDRGGQDDAQDE